MNIRQAVKMAWKSIWGKKGRSVLTMLGIIIGIAAVMTIVSAMNGYTRKTMEQYEAMGSNQFQVSIWSYQYDKDGNAISKDYFPELYDYCNSIKEYVLGVTPSGYLNATVIYGTKNSNNMQPEWDDQGNIVGGDLPPSLYLGSDQYSICNNLTVAKGRDLSVLDSQRYNQVCVMGSQAAKTFFGSADPVGKTLQVNGENFLVVGRALRPPAERHRKLQQHGQLHCLPVHRKPAAGPGGRHQLRGEGPLLRGGGGGYLPHRGVSEGTCGSHDRQL